MSKRTGFTTEKGFHESVANADNAIVNADGTYSGFTKDSNGVLKTGDEIIERLQLVFSGSGTGSAESGKSIPLTVDQVNVGDEFIIYWNYEYSSTIYNITRAVVTGDAMLHCEMLFDAGPVNNPTLITGRIPRISAGSSSLYLRGCCIWSSNDTFLLREATVTKVYKVIK